MDSKRIVEACRFIGEHWTGDDGDLVCQAADYIERLEAVVRAGDVVESAQTALGQTWAGTPERLKAVKELASAERERDAARSRVNLPPAHVDDGYSQTDKCGPDCTLEVLRPGVVQCNGDGLKCPNKEASDGLQAKQS